MGMSAYVLSRVLPAAPQRFAELVAAVGGEQRRFALAELHDLLTRLGPAELRGAVDQADLHGLSPLDRNYVAAMVEQACTRAAVAPPDWAGRIEPPEAPHFAAPFVSLRLHLLRASPVPFKRRNIFVDAALGDRV